MQTTALDSTYNAAEHTFFACIIFYRTVININVPLIENELPYKHIAMYTLLFVASILLN